MKSLSLNLKDLCKQRKLSLAQLSALSKVPKATLHSWTHGVSPNIEQLRKVSSVLQVSIHRLAFGEPDPNEEIGREILNEIFSGDIRVTLHKIERR